jgi:lipopolysaccharide export system permease protein
LQGAGHKLKGVILFLYILREVIPQFVSSLVILASVLIISQLAKLTELLVAFGVSLENIFLPLLYIVLPFISFNIPIAFLFAVLLAFGRFSSDGEYAGLLACGFSLRRALIPVALVACVLYVMGVVATSHLEPWGRRELVRFVYDKTKNEVDNMVRLKMQPGVFIDNFLGYVFYAREVSSDRKTLGGVMLAPPSGSKQSFTIFAPSGSITGKADTGDLKLSLNFGTAYSTAAEHLEGSVMKFRHAEFDLLRLFREQLVSSDVGEEDYRSLGPDELSVYIEKIGSQTNRDEGLYRRARYLFHNRISAPFAVFVFGAFGLVLGVVDPRSQRNRAYVGAITAIIVGYVFMMGFKWLAERGWMNVILAAWLPQLILMAAGAFLLYQKNRLPPSEPILERANLPWKWARKK